MLKTQAIYLNGEWDELIECPPSSESRRPSTKPPPDGGRPVRGLPSGAIAIAPRNAKLWSQSLPNPMHNTSRITMPPRHFASGPAAATAAGGSNLQRLDERSVAQNGVYQLRSSSGGLTAFPKCGDLARQ